MQGAARSRPARRRCAPAAGDDRETPQLYRIRPGTARTGPSGASWQARSQARQSTGRQIRREMLRRSSYVGKSEDSVTSWRVSFAARSPAPCSSLPAGSPATTMGAVIAATTAKHSHATWGSGGLVQHVARSVRRGSWGRAITVRFACAACRSSAPFVWYRCAHSTSHTV